MEPPVKRQKIVWKIYCDICFLPFSRTDSLARHKTNRSCTKEAVSQPVLQKGIISEDQGNLLSGIDNKTSKREGVSHPSGMVGYWSYSG